MRDLPTICQRLNVRRSLMPHALTSNLNFGSAFTLWRYRQRSDFSAFIGLGTAIELPACIGAVQFDE